MSGVVFLLVSCFLFAFTFVFWKTLFQRNTGGASPVAQDTGPRHRPPPCPPRSCILRTRRNKKRRNTGEMSSKSTSLVLVTSSSSTQSTKSSTDECLSVNSQWDINLQDSITMEREIFVNLNNVEYNLAEME